jgi:hypothetical protein
VRRHLSPRTGPGQELPPQTRKLWDAIKSLATEAGHDWKHFTFTRRALRDRIGWSVTQTRVHLERLCELECIVPRQGRNGQRFEYGILIDPKVDDGFAHIGLIDPANLELRLQPDGKNPHPAAPGQTSVSGSIPYENELSAAPDGQPDPSIKDTEKTAVAS